MAEHFGGQPHHSEVFRPVVDHARALYYDMNKAEELLVFLAEYMTSGMLAGNFPSVINQSLTQSKPGKSFSSLMLFFSFELKFMTIPIKM